MANNNHFDLQLDTLAPTGSITRPAQFMNANDNLVIDKGDATYMKVWFDNNSTGAKTDSGYTSASWEAAATSKMTAFVNDGQYYYHLVLMDSVNNESNVYNTQLIIFDTVAPALVADSFYLADPDTGSHIITNDLTNIPVHFEYTESANGSGVNQYTLSGVDIDTVTATLPGAGTVDTYISFKSGTHDGLKTISLVMTDNAGNVSQTYTASITLDTELDKPTLVLVDSSGVAVNPNINYHNVTALLTSTDTDIVGWKIWEGDTEPSTWETTQLVSGQPLDVELAMTLSAGDGTKTVHAKVKDSAGTEISADDVVVLIDTVAPTNVSITSSANIISNVSGYDTATLTLTGQDASSGIANYEIKVGNTIVYSGTTPPATQTLTSANSMVEGSNTITFTVTDAAGNSSSDTCTVILDTTAPTASIGTLNTWYNAYFGITVTHSDANTVSKIYVWTSTTAEDTDPGQTTAINATSSPQSIGSGSINWNNAQSAANYMHVKVVDSVGNAAYVHEQFGYDSVAPDTPTIRFSENVYNSTTASTTITYDLNDTSGVVSMQVLGDITNPTPSGDWENVATTRAVTLTTPDGMKSVTVRVKDAAGNISTTSVAATCELDTTPPSGTLTLYENDDTTLKPAISPVATFIAHLAASDDAFGGFEYKIYGDFTDDGIQAAQGITESDAEWTTYEPDAGLAYKTIDNLICTSGDGTKNVYIKLRDNAGHLVGPIGQSFIYDTSAPVVVVSNVDYNIVSKVNALRRNSTGTIAGKYSDECNFTFTPNEPIQAYKVVAYATQAAAIAGDETDDAIPNTNGSVNMSATGLNSDAAVNSTIKGADFELALGGPSSSGEYDGVHYVVVYVQDKGGTWSEAAIFATE